MKYDLSIIIPARNEEWLSQTIKDILANKRGNTEILVGLDGYWPEPGLAVHPDVTVIHYPKSIGQRAMQNRLASISRAKYIMKTDAHTAWDEGFDVKMMEKMEDDMTMVPVMRNLHVFDWVCVTCGDRVYQGPDPMKCRNETCNFDENGGETKSSYRKELVWIAKTNPTSTAYRFNRNLQFKYFPELRAEQVKSGLAETMSLQGSCFMCTRERYWALGLCDESWGSWGQQGTEVAIKTWLSGGRVVCNMDTWYAHLFRTQDGFSFPYPMSGSAQQRARKISQDIFLNGKWDKAKYPLSWLLEKFWPQLQKVTDKEARWEQADLDALNSSNALTKGIIYYTDNRLNLKIARKVQARLKEMGLPIVSASLKPMTFGKNIHVKMKRGIKAYFTQILSALEASDADIVYFCEHDVLYNKSHFDFTPPRNDRFYFNTNVWKVDWDTGKAVRVDKCEQVSGMVCYRTLALEFYQKKLDEIESFDRHYEPQGNRKTFESIEPLYDIRHSNNLTPTKWSPEDFRNVKNAIGWQESVIKI